MAEEPDLKNYAPPPLGKLFFVGWAAALLGVLALTAGLVLARDLWIERQTSQLEHEYEAGRRVLVTHVSFAPSSRRITLPASVHGYIETPIYAKVAGYLRKINVDKGDRVKQGQILAVLESPELDHQVLNARASYAIAKLTDGRNQALVKSAVIAQQTADESHAAMLQAKATLDQLIAMQAYEIIRAPVTGMVTARYVDPGALVPQATAPSTGGTPIVAIATLSPLRVYSDVPQNVAPFIKDGDRATVTVSEYPRRKFEGSVTRHPDALNTATRTMLVEVDLDNKDRALYPGMYATTDFSVTVPKGVPMVPDDALVFREGKIYLPVVRDRRINLAEVTLGNDNGQTVEITHGIAGDDIVAINVGQAVRDGEIVQPMFQDSKAGAK